jgi:NAD(P)-dependent dehydrogenase (short-subunit alcohol dehydrogenase family)
MDDRVALITGAASGIGEATARRLAADAAGLVLCDRDADRLTPLAEELGTTRVLAAAFDVADEAAWDRLEAEARERFGKVDQVVANAGVAGAGPIADLAYAEWRRILSANLDGVFLTLRAGMRLISEVGGAMVVVASAAALKAEPGVAAYGASKAGAVQLMKVAAKEGAPRRVRVNAVLPGGVETPIWRALPGFREAAQAQGEASAFAAMASASTPLGRFARPAEIAEMIAFLLSEEAATITGTALLADGGYTL